MTLLLLQQDSQSKLLHFSSAGNRLYFLELPMAACLIIPLAIFRIHTGDQSLEHLLGPIALYLAIVAIFSFVSHNFFSRFPSLISFIAGIITYLFMTLFAAAMNIFSQQLVGSYQTLFGLAAWVILVLYIVRSVRIMLQDVTS